MTRDGVWVFSGLGVVGQVLVALLLLICILALFGVRGPLDTLRGWLWGYELWAAFVVAAVATGGSLFYSEVAGYIPCELCWYQRLCMYPLSIFLLLMAIWGADRAARYIIALPIVGAGVSIYHMLIGYGAITEPKACSISAPGGCGTQLDPLSELRLPPDRNARVHRLPPSHRILGPCKRRNLRGRGYPSGRCLAGRKRDSSARRPQRHRRPCAPRAAPAAHGRRRGARSRLPAASSSS